MCEKVSQTLPQERLKVVTDQFVATAQAIIDKHGVRTENDGFEGPFSTPFRRVNITTPAVSDDFDMVLARVRIQRDYLRALTPEELQTLEEDEAEAKRCHVPPILRSKPNKEKVGTLDKEGYLIEVSNDGGYKWQVCFVAKTIEFGKPVKTDNGEVEGTLRTRECRLKTLEKISEALDQQPAKNNKISVPSQTLENKL